MLSNYMNEYGALVEKFLTGARRSKSKVKFIQQQAEVAQGVPGTLRPRIFLTFGTTRVVGCQPYAPAAFTQGEIPGTHFQRLNQLKGTLFRREPRKNHQ
jgi:hypothetical protein